MMHYGVEKIDDGFCVREFVTDAIVFTSSSEDKCRQVWRTLVKGSGFGIAQTPNFFSIKYKMGVDISD